MRSVRKRSIWAVSVAAAAVPAPAGCEGDTSDQGAGGADGGKPSASEPASPSQSPSAVGSTPGPGEGPKGENATVPVDTKRLKVFAGPVFTGATDGLRRMDPETFLEKLTLEEPGHEFYYRVEVTERFHEGAVTYLFHITDG